MAGTYFRKRNEFSEAHYDLPKQQCLFDIDRIKGEWLTFDISEGKEEATYVEYTRLKHSSELPKFDKSRIKFLALFELKYCFSERVQDAMLLKEGTSAWAEFMMAKDLGMRFFFVVASNGLPPFTFYEFDMISGTYFKIPIKLNYDIGNKSQKKACINYYWKSVLNLLT